MRMITVRDIVAGVGAMVLTLSGCQREQAARTEPARPAVVSEEEWNEPADTAIQPVRRTWHRVARRTSQQAPLVRYRAVRRPEALRDTAAPPANARLLDLTLKASEFFRIDPTQPAEVRGREGTVVRIPAQALVDARNAPAKSPVYIELKECYTLADLLLSDHVSMNAAGEPLQTGGMLLVRAASARGQQLRLASGQALEVALPAAQRHPSLQLYHTPGRQPRQWVALAQPAPPVPDEQVYADAQPMPAYGSGPDELSRRIRYPQTAAGNRTEGLVFTSFVVDEAGRVLSPKVLRGLGDGCDEEALRVLRQSSGQWLPGRRGGKAVKVKMQVPIRFALKDNLLTAAESTAVTSTIPEDMQPESVAASAEAPAEPGSVFSTSALGWLTYLRPWRPASRTTELYVAADADAHTVVRLIYPGSSVILEGQAQPEGYSFGQVPAQRRAVLLGLRYFNGSPYVALREIVPGTRLTEPLEFRETTLGELEQLLERLN